MGFAKLGENIGKMAAKGKKAGVKKVANTKKMGKMIKEAPSNPVPLATHVKEHKWSVGITAAGTAADGADIHHDYKRNLAQQEHTAVAKGVNTANIRRSSHQGVQNRNA